jgi:hypothetical protein
MAKLGAARGTWRFHVFRDHEFAGQYLPGYFWRLAEDDLKRPTFISLDGNDDSGEEGFFWNGPAAARRGYSYFTIALRGHCHQLKASRKGVKS